MRIQSGRDEKTTFVILDAQNVKNTGTAEEKGYDVSKKVSGIKRHIMFDTQGFPYAIAVTPANVTDREGALAACRFHKAALSKVNNVLADVGYTGQPFADAIHDTLGAAVEVVKRNELHVFAVIPKRWVVEWSFAWLGKCRRLWKNCERQLNISLQFVNLAFLTLLLRRL
jgi:transposase